jgi:hypothetical protein
MTIPSTTMLYRPSDTPNPDVWGWKVDHQAFADADVPAALKDGWVLHPTDAKPDDKAAVRGKGETPKAE